MKQLCKNTGLKPFYLAELIAVRFENGHNRDSV